MAAEPIALSDPSVWSQLGPVAGGILAFIITSLWMFREWTWASREKEWHKTLQVQQTAFDTQIEKTRVSCTQAQTELKQQIEKQWQMLTDLTRTASDDLVRVIEKSTQAMAEVKTFLEVRMR